MTNITSVRIINVDSYMSSSVQGIDITYSEFRGSSINYVPIIRIFGTTNTGKKICLHVHGVFPYFYIPYDGTDDLNSLMYQIAATVDKSVNISFGQASSNTQHIYKITLVSGVPFYGYHPKSHQFLKIYLYNPNLIRKVSNILQNEAILGKLYQPHETHIPYILQFMIDYNLHGMSYLMLTDLKLRPDSIENDFSTISKTSFCELEGDILCENILNRLEVLSGKLTANPGIAILWEDEKQRRRNKGDDSQISPGLSLEDSNVSPTKTHENFKRILLERLINTTTDRETGEKINNITVYPAETPPNEIISNASNIDVHTPLYQNDISLSDSTLLNDTLNATLDVEAENLFEVLQDLGENIEEDSILSQINKEPEDEQDYFDLSLPMAAVTTPVKLDIGNKSDEDLWDDDDDLDRTIVPQLDGNCDQESSPDSLGSNIVHGSDSSDNENDTNAKKLHKNRSQTKQYKMLPITITSTTKKSDSTDNIEEQSEKKSQDSEIIEKVKRKLEFPKETLNTTIHEEFLLCQLTKKIKKNEMVSVTSTQKDSIDQENPLTNKKMSLAQLHDIRNNYMPIEGCSKQLSQNPVDNYTFQSISQNEYEVCPVSSGLDSSIPLFQPLIEETKQFFSSNSIPHSQNTIENSAQTVMSIVPKNPAPTRNEVIKSLNLLQIPVINQQKPFYSNAEDVTGAVEIGYNLLKIGSKSVVDLEDFKCTFEGIDNLRRWFLNNVKWTYKNINNIKLSHCQNRKMLITPAKIAPTRKNLKSWIKPQKTYENITVKQKIYLPILSPKENDDEDDDCELSLTLPSLPSISGEKVNNSCQITGVTLNNTYDFKMTSDNYQNARTISDHQYLTILVVELHIQTRGDFKPNPEHDSIRAIFYSALNDVPDNFDRPSKIQGIFAINSISINSEEIKSPILTTAGFSCNVIYTENEIELFKEFVKFVQNCDPDIVAGYEIEMLSWGYLIDRAAVLGINLPAQLSRIKNDKSKRHDKECSIIGRITLDIWRLFRHEIALQSYSFENLAYHILHKRIPLFSFKDLTFWWDHKSSVYRHRTVNHYLIRIEGILQLIKQLDLIGRTSELARLFGIQFYEVLSRGSQFRVESMMLRLAKPLNFIPVSPSVQQRAKMRAPEFLPLILEPESKFYVDPVIVLDFQSLYPSMIIAYNYCFSTCIGRVEHLGKNSPFEFGATHLKISKKRLRKLIEKDLLNFSPCGIGFVKSKIRDGILPRMLREILDTRLMVKNSMKENKDDKLLQKVLHNRQLGLKLIANVTYGYTSANFSGRMPAVEVGDSVVSKGRETLQRAIEMVNKTTEWDAKVVYGDTDSLFVLVPGKTRKEAFEIGKKIADAITNDNPKPVKLKLEKVYQPCILQTKKRYVGYMYECSNQTEPIYEAKGIETVRRDGCPAVSKMLEKCLRILFETKNVSLVKQYVLRQFNKIFAGRVSLQDLTFAKQYRGASGYRPGACVPALELARKWTTIDKRNEPRSGERVPYIIANGPPGLPLIRLVKSPREFLIDPSLRPNTLYYITKVIIPPINRCFTLIGADLNTWFNQMPRKQFQYLPNSLSSSPGKKFTISQYFATTICAACGQKTQIGLCDKCKYQPQITSVILLEKIRNWEKLFYNTRLICESCTGVSNESNCMSLDCPILYSLSQSTRDLQQEAYARQLLKELHF